MYDIYTIIYEVIFDIRILTLKTRADNIVYTHNE